MRSIINKNILHYCIIELIGRGGMGVVYKAEDLKLKRLVAIKFLPPHIGVNTEEHQRFEIEARAAAALNHPNIATIYAIEEYEDQTFIVMEYIEGRELEEVINADPITPQGSAERSALTLIGVSNGVAPSVKQYIRGLPIENVINYTTQIAEGLQAAHEKEIVHRDIKSSNVMITNKGQAKIMDFGLAQMGANIRLTKKNIARGTVAYMSPELWDGQPASERSDIWSLGVVMYEMMSGDLPFCGDTQIKLIYSTLNDEPLPLTQIRQDIPEQLNQIVMKSLSKNADARYLHVTELVADLNAVNLSSSPKNLPQSSRPALNSPGKSAALIASLATLILATLLILSFSLPQNNPPPERASIAVLPFVDMSAKNDQEYFCDGISEELINSLAQIPGLYVAARTSAFRFKGKNEDIRTVGKKLNVNTILEGSVRKSDKSIRIAAQLINVENGYQIWSELYERNMNDLFVIQEDISRSIIAALKVRLVESSTPAKRPTENLEAYTTYLKGRYCWNKRSELGLKKSIQYFQAALEKDPKYALAYAGIADSYIVLSDWGYLPPNEAHPKAKAAATKALELDKHLGAAYTSLAYTAFIYEWKWQEAEHLFQQAIKLDPNYATAHQWYAEFLTTMGRQEEAIAEIERARLLDPLSLIINTIKGWILTQARKYDEATKQLQKTLELDPDFRPAHIYLRWNYEFQGEFQKSAEELKQVLITQGVGDKELATLDSIFNASGLDGVYRWYLGKLKHDAGHQYIAADELAATYVGLKDFDNAFKWLETAFRDRIPQNVYLNVMPIWDPLRNDPRFIDLLDRIGLRRPK